MNIESEIFKKSVIEYNKLINYGFKRKENAYLISKNILNDTFQIQVKITLNGNIEGHIYDLALNDEYTNYRIKNQNDEFVNKVKNEFINFLIDIKKHCTKETYFTTPQANRVSDLIIKEYQDKPEFAWEKYPGYGIFKNSYNFKWYALIMNIDKSKIAKERANIEIINLKLPVTEVKSLLQKKGFYKAYHMNKDNWITIILDDTLTDDLIMTYVKISHELSLKKH